MSDRGTSNGPNTRNPNRPASKPSRLDQFADNMFDNKTEGLTVTSRKEKKKYNGK